MSNIVRLNAGLPAEISRQPVHATLKPWQMDELDALLPKIKPALDAWRAGASTGTVVDLLMVSSGVSKATAYRWAKALKESGPSGLVSQYTGRQAQPQPWWPRAMLMFQSPTKQSNRAIAFKLRGEGHDVSTAQVGALRKRVPSDQAETSRKALGGVYYWQNHLPYAMRDWSVVPPGLAYCVDGHSCDFYLEHPVTGSPFRPELTLWIDLGSMMALGWWLSGFETAFDLRWSLSSVMLKHDHVPGIVFLDHGAGRAEQFSGPVSGFGVKMGFDVQLAKARNAREKPIEARFADFEDCFGSHMPTYSNNRTDDGFRAFRSKWNKGKVPRISVAQCIEMMQSQYFDQWNNEPHQHSGRGRIIPAELWESRETHPVLVPADAVCRPRLTAKVRHWRVRFAKRYYQANELSHFELREVIVEFDEATLNHHVWIYTLEGRFVCIAEAIGLQPAMQETQIEAIRKKRLEGRLRRLEIRKAEAAGQERLPISAAAVLDALEAPQMPALNLSQQSLNAGHSFMERAPRAEPSRPTRTFDAAEHAAVVAAIEAQAAPTAPQQTPEQRFERYLTLRAASVLDADDQQWFTQYAQSAECLGFIDMLDAFGYVPGVTPPEDNT